MLVVVNVLVEGEARPPLGVPVTVQLRDTRLQDAPAVTIAEAKGSVAGPGPVVAVVSLQSPASSAGAAVWAHIDVDSDGRVSRGDFVTTQSYVVPDRESSSVDVTLKQV